MEYTKDMIYKVSYGQTAEKERVGFLRKLSQRMMRHKFITITVCMTTLLIALDFMLISSFIQVLGKI